MYLLDTNSCIDFTLGRSRALVDQIRRSYRLGIAISTITLAELRVGARRSDVDPEDDRRLDRLVATLVVHPFDVRAADEYGMLARQVGVKRRGLDRLIAAHARALGLTLVTNNESDFADVPGLVVENWTKGV